MIRSEESNNQPSDDATQTSRLYLFSPLRASIVYSRYQIMMNLLEYNANVYELFGASTPNKRPVKCSNAFNSRTNDEYLNSLKFFHRQFLTTTTSTAANDTDLPRQQQQQQQTGNEHTLNYYLDVLNDHIDDPNVYRRMLVEFVKSLIHKINSNLNVIDRLYEYLNSVNQNNVEYIDKLNQSINNGEQAVDWDDYVNIVRDFIKSLDTFLSSNPENGQNFNNNNTSHNTTNQNNGSADSAKTKKTNVNESLFEFSLSLMRKYFKPKSLKEISRFKLREMLFQDIDQQQKHKSPRLKNDQLNYKIVQLNLPKHLRNYVLFKN